MALTGTDKQITAATDIRSTWLALAEKLLAGTFREERAARNPKIAEDRVRLLRAIELAPTISEAAFWLDTRAVVNGSNGALGGMRLIVENFDDRDAPLPRWGLY